MIWNRYPNNAKSCHNTHDSRFVGGLYDNRGCKRFVGQLLWQ